MYSILYPVIDFPPSSAGLVQESVFLVGESFVIISCGGGSGANVEGPEVAVGVADTSSENGLEPAEKRALILKV